MRKTKRDGELKRAFTRGMDAFRSYGEGAKHGYRRPYLARAWRAGWRWGKSRVAVPE